MHEFSLVKDLVATILDSIPKSGQKTRIEAVSLRVGILELHSEEAFRQSFEALARGTPLDGARLDLALVPATFKCGNCGREGTRSVGEVDVHAAAPYAECPGCGGVVPLSGGRGITDVEITFPD